MGGDVDVVSGKLEVSKTQEDVPNRLSGLSQFRGVHQLEAAQRSDDLLRKAGPVPGLVEVGMDLISQNLAQFGEHSAFSLGEPFGEAEELRGDDAAGDGHARRGPT